MNTTLPPRDRALVAATLDVLVPPRPAEGIAGAGRDAVVDYVLDKLAATPDVGALLDLGFADLQAQARHAHARSFVELAGETQTQLVRQLEQAQPLFIPILLMHVYTGYYQQPDVLEALGYPARPPFPDGYDVTVKDDALLAKLRSRVGTATPDAD